MTARACLPAALALALGAAGLLAPRPAAADIGIAAALVVGIDKYQHEMPLHGAVADATDIAAALRRAGVAQTTLLLDAAASRQAIEAAWRAMLDRARPGDRLLFSFAGHGTKQPELKPGSEPDGKDEVLVLAGFDRTSRAGLGERLVDNEIGDWTRAAARKGVSVMVVVDACHSGNIVRAIHIDGIAPTVRFVTPIEVPREQLLAADAPYWNPTADSASAPLIRDNVLAAQRTRSAGTGAKPFPGSDSAPRSRPGANVLQLSAAMDDEETPEVPIDDGHGAKVPRGVLSYSFARALEGRADLNGDGVTALEELRLFIRSNVRDLAGSRQTPVVFPDDPAAGATAVFGRAAEGTPPPPPPAGLVVAVTDPGRLAAASAALAGTAGVTVGSDRSQADLIWDPGRGEVVTKLAELAAEHIDAAALPAVVRKWQVVARLQALSLHAPMLAAIRPNDGSHAAGEQIVVSFAAVPFAHLAVFNLAGDGTVQFLYPGPKDPPDLPPGRPFELPLKVAAPFGADHFVAIATEQPVPALLALLRAGDGRPAGAALDTAIAGALGGGRRAMVVQGLYSVAVR